MSYPQRETPILAELCTLFVEDLYGELAARVFSVLARHGRQTLAALVRASYLNGRQIKHGLVVLIQQHLIFHSAIDPLVNYYEIDWQQSYALARYGRTLKLVEDRFGKKATNVVSNLVTLGHTRISDLKEAYFPSPDRESGDNSDGGNTNGAVLGKRKADGTRVNGNTAKNNGIANGLPSELEGAKSTAKPLANGNLSSAKDSTSSTRPNGAPNGTGASGTSVEDVPDVDEEQDNDAIQSVEELYAIIHYLMLQGWIMKVEQTQYLSPGDLHELVRQEAVNELPDGNNPTGTKAKEELAVSILQRKRQIRDEWLSVPKFASRKRHANDPDFSATSKRLKMTGSNERSNLRDDIVILDSRLVIRVNPQKVAVAMRTDQLVRLVEQRLGRVTAQIYRIMLYTLEGNLARCYEEWPDRNTLDPAAGMDAGIDSRFLVTARDVAKKIERSVELFQGLDPHAIVQITKRGHVDKHNRLTQPIDPYDLSLDERTKVVDKHIQLLSDDPFHFVTWHSRAGFSQWHVEFDEIPKAMIQHEIENTIAARKGALGVKLIRALRKKGKLDERQTCNVMMMSGGDLRGVVNDMTVQGFIQTQEIPRVERREAKHSMHLIWYDRQRAREKLLHDTYKGMVRIMQRIAFEREKVQPLLGKAERSDVVGNEEKWLSKGELDALRKWKEVEEKLLLQLFREDDLVATLRDFIGPLISA